MKQLAGMKFKKKGNDKMSNNVYFWGGFMSNFAIHKSFEYKGFTFITSEQAFMWEKARTFKDLASAEMILSLGQDPKTAKKMGRQVSNYNDSIWSEKRYDIMVSVLKAKFSVPFYKDLLIETGNKTLVEASPFDRIWGIGYGVENAERNKGNWGENLLGKALMEVRENIKEG